MDIHRIYARISPIFRNRRFKQFVSKIHPVGDDRVLDVGGYPVTWTAQASCAGSIDILNVHEIDYDGSRHPGYGISTLVGDGCDLGFGDAEYDIVFSNSVIEHVGTWENQEKFAAEARRVGKRLWIQTPAREFFIEPHYIAPFVHWFPKSIRRRLLRNFTIWGWINRPSKDKVDQMLAEIRLLSHDEMSRLFPDCEILKERFLGIFTKSYVAFRGEGE